MDQIYWKPNWQEPDDEEFLPKLQAVVDRCRWVLDGNYNRTVPIKWKTVDLVVWLDLSFSRTVFRVTKRALNRSLSGAEIWPETGNVETLRKCFLSSDSIIWWSMTSYRRNRQRYCQAMNCQRHSHIQFVRLRSPADVDSFLAQTVAAIENRKSGHPSAS